MANLLNPFSNATRVVEVLKTVLQKSTFRSVIVFFLVLGLERIFEKQVFSCPDIHFFSYGALFIVGPALCLFNIAMLLNTEFWDLVTGCYRRNTSTQLRRRKRRICKRLVKNVFQSSLPALVWLCLSLVDGNYYVCARLGQQKTAEERADGDKEMLKKVRDEFAHAKAESQLIAWGLFLSLVLISTTFVLVRRCCCLDSEGILPNTHDYDRIEAETAAKRFREKMEEEARKQGIMQVDELFKNGNQNCEGNGLIRQIRHSLATMYPRTTGDLSEPYRSEYKQHKHVQNGDMRSAI